MKSLTESYRKVRYDLRPAKQVERMMLVDGFRRLDAAGMPLADYRYVGMGSVHFYDFSLFHRYLGVSKMLSVEASEQVRKRVRFNKPFDFIDVEIDFIGNVIPKLSRDERHILWLDYDSGIRASYLEDLAQAAEVLSVGSVLLITLDLEPPKGQDTPAKIREYLTAEVGRFLPGSPSLKEFARGNLASLYARIVDRCVSRAIAGRIGVTFSPLFNFAYQDGHRMLTIGGMLTSTSEQRWLAGSSITKTVYFRPTLTAKAYEIRVPVLTRRERLLMDAAMPCKEGWSPREFELDSADIAAYREIYRFNPNFAELIV